MSYATPQTFQEWRAFVRVDHPDHGPSGGYWNPLGPWRASRDEAEGDIATYKANARIPRATKIDDRSLSV